MYIYVLEQVTNQTRAKCRMLAEAQCRVWLQPVGESPTGRGLKLYHKAMNVAISL